MATTKKTRIRITLVEKKGKKGCSRGHRIGDSWDYDTERGTLCPFVMHTAFVYADILRYGGKMSEDNPDVARFCCPDPDVLNIFKVERVKDSEDFENN